MFSGTNHPGCTFHLQLRFNNRRAMRAWTTRHVTSVVAITVAVVMAVIAVIAAMEAATWSVRLVAARQLYGLTAFGFLVASSLIGPMTAILPRLPAKVLLLAARRSVGVSAFAFAVAHVVCYLPPTLVHDWRELYRPGTIWMISLSLGLMAFTDLAILAWTSRDAAVKAMGGKRWKRLHRTVYIALPVIFLHALLIGSDFGSRRSKEMQPDFGSLVAFSIAMAAWILVIVLRALGKCWPRHSSRPHVPAP